MKIFKLTISAAVLLCSGCMTVEKLQARTVRQLFEFVSRLGDSRQLTISIQADDALYTIVHIRQQHYSALYNRSIEKQIEEESNPEKIAALKERYFEQICQINAVQKEIYNFLLPATSGKDFLFVEGRSYPHHYRDTFLAEFIPESISDVQKILDQKGDFSRPVPQPPYFLGASMLIHQERKMTVLGAENLALLNLTLSLYENKKLSGAALNSLLKECHEAREDQMIKNVLEDIEDLNYRMSSLRFLICGSKHDFKENIEKWNKANPQKKVNLLVFTPASLM